MMYRAERSEQNKSTSTKSLVGLLKSATFLQSVKQRISPKALGSDQGGNFALLLALLMPITLFLGGGAVDYMRLNAVRTDMVEACDAAGLAMARLSETPDLIAEDDKAKRDEVLSEYGEAFFRDNFSHAQSVSDLHVAFDIDEQTISPDISGKIKTLFLQAAYGLVSNGNLDEIRDSFSVTCGNEITRRGSGRVDLALVVDVSGSMGQSVGGEKKIDSLRDATESLMDVLFGSENVSDNVRIGVVPFNQFANPGDADGWDNDWVDENANAIYHGSRFFHVDEDGVINTNVAVNHTALFDSVPGTGWDGCVEARPYPLDELDAPPAIDGASPPSASAIADAVSVPTAFSGGGLDQYEQRTRTAFLRAPSFSVPASELSRAENTFWVPMFNPDEPDCSNQFGNNCWGSNNNINGINLTVGAFPRSFDAPAAAGHNGRLNRFWFDTPRAGNHTDNQYNNRAFIRDIRFTHQNQAGPAQNFERYAHIVDKSRDALGVNRGTGNHGGTVTEIADFRTFLRAAGARDAGTHEYIVRQAYAGWFDPDTGLYEGKYNLNPDVHVPPTDAHIPNRGPNRSCPLALLNSVDDRRDVKDYMDSLVANGYTNSATGTIWGQRLLSPEAPFESPIEDDDGQWQKAIVIMTDGQNTVRARDTHNLSQMTAYGFALEERMGENIDTPSEMRNEINDKFLRTCQRMKERGYLVYTIMFDLNNNNVEKLYRACASKPSDPFFFDVDDGDELDEAFEDIAADLVKLHISR